jgi:hypothetical protein
VRYDTLDDSASENRIHESTTVQQNLLFLPSGNLAFQFERALSHLDPGRTLNSPSGNAAGKSGTAVGSASDGNSDGARRMSRMIPCARAYESLFHYHSGNMKDWLIC